MRTRSAAAPATDPAPAASPPQGLQPLLEAMGYDPVGLDMLGARTGLDAAQLQADEAGRLKAALEAGLTAYTYLDDTPET